MQAIVFRCGELSFALEVRALAEIVPAVSLRTLPHAPNWVAGLLNLRGQTLPVIDLCELLTGRAARRVLSTRVMIVFYPSHEKPEHLLGLMAESVTEIQRIEDSAVRPSGLATPEAPYLGGVITKGNNSLQIVKPSELLPAEVRERLFTEAKAAGEAQASGAGVVT